MSSIFICSSIGDVGVHGSIGVVQGGVEVRLRHGVDVDGDHEVACCGEAHVVTYVDDGPCHAEMMAQATWHVACGALWSLEKSVDEDHVEDALDAPYDVLDVDDLVHKHSRDGALGSSETNVEDDHVGDALDDP
jgi:hypothetical protein